MGNYNLFIDDEREIHQSSLYGWKYGKGVEFTIVRSYDEFVKVLNEKGVPYYISFDHDLGLHYFPDGSEKSAMACAKYLIEYLLDRDLPCPQFNVHSGNPPGALNITSLLDNYAKHYRRTH